MEIVNIVTSGSFNQKVSLDVLAASLPDVFSYDPEMYHGGYLRLKDYTVTVYRSGKYIVPGVKRFSDIDDIYGQMCALLKGIVEIDLIDRPSIRNMVVISKIAEDIDLNRKFMDLMEMGEDVSYEPEVFPGLIWRSERGTVNIYSSGKVLYLGQTDSSVLDDLEKYVKDVLSF